MSERASPGSAGNMGLLSFGLRMAMGRGVCRSYGLCECTGNG